MHDARAVANKILDCCDEMGLSITNMSINKILYFAHGLFMAQFGRPLLKNKIEAWEHGPVIRAVYREFKECGSDSIKGRAKRLDLTNECLVVAIDEFEPDVEIFLRNIAEAYGPVPATRLRSMTHQPGSPWASVWDDGSKINLGMEITNDSIRAYFHERLRKRS